ncbi:MAG: GNAT family N-acetyltransferase [Clostridiales bacterium]|nr:GNAT family N-acetyltransferase [Clostridiales bacterium]
MEITAKYVRFRLQSAELLQKASLPVQQLDWQKDIPLIRRFYAHFTDDVIEPPTEDENIGTPYAVVENSEILSFALPFSFKAGETEIGAVMTLPAHRGNGYAKAVIAAMAADILASGNAATLTTGADNAPMRAAARAVGMQEK